MKRAPDNLLTSTHWGTYRVEVAGGQVIALNGFEQDPDPSPSVVGLLMFLTAPHASRHR